MQRIKIECPYCPEDYKSTCFSRGLSRPEYLEAQTKFLFDDLKEHLIAAHRDKVVVKDIKNGEMEKEEKQQEAQSAVVASLERSLKEHADVWEELSKY